MEVNEQQLKEDLLEVYEGFLKNQKNIVIKELAIKLSNDYNGLVGTGLVSENLNLAIGSLTDIIQYGLGTFDDDILIRLAHEILDILKNNIQPREK